VSSITGNKYSSIIKNKNISNKEANFEYCKINAHFKIMVFVRSSIKNRLSVENRCRSGQFYKIKI